MKKNIHINIKASDLTLEMFTLCLRLLSLAEGFQSFLMGMVELCLGNVAQQDRCVMANFHDDVWARVDSLPFFLLLLFTVQH